MSVDPAIVGRCWFFRAPGILERDVGEEVVLRAAGRKDVALLSTTAGAVWQMMDEPRTLRNIVEGIARAYGRPAPEVAPDVEVLLDGLVQRGLVEVISDADD